MRTLTIYRERYIIEDDGNGGSDAVETETITDVYPIHGSRLTLPGGYHESPAREVVGYLRGEYLCHGADGGEWFGREEPSVSDYATGEEERVTGHLSGFSATEERAIVRMLAWLDARDDARAREYINRTL